MDKALEDFVAKTIAAETKEELGQLLLQELTNDGYENLVVASTERRRVEEVVWADLPEGYAPAYLGNRWDAIDPVLVKALKSNRPFNWNELRGEELAPAQHQFLEDCKDIGVHSGLTIPLHGPGMRCDLISVSARAAEVAPSRRLLRIYMLATNAWFRLQDLERARRRRRSELSPREIECLQWAKEGKTNWEIGMILSISERTVEFHIKNAMEKLGVSNRILAFVVALQNGFISL